jgi:hypothetical protein
LINRRAFGLGLVAAGLAEPARALDRARARAITVQAAAFSHFSALDRDRTRFDRLTFLGGLDLRADDPEFGGFSGLILAPDGERFLTISDRAHWMTGRLRTQDDAPLGVAEARLGPFLGPDGRRLKETRYFDCESVARQGQTLFVGVERSHDILQFDLNAAGEPIGRARLTAVPEEMKRLYPNAGIEALGMVPAGAEWAGHLLAMAEREGREADKGAIPAFLIGPRPGRLALKRIGDFDVTDLAFLPDGDLLVLERRFVPFFGIGFRIRRIPGRSIRPGALLEGEILIAADLSHQIDNMEGMAVHRSPRGRTIITLISDNNFSLLQRTLLLRFALEA